VKVERPGPERPGDSGRKARNAGHEAAPEHHHRDIQGGAARAAVFGISDGLTTNVSLILGVAGATTGPSFVRLAGLAGLIGGAFSMAAGEYVSMRAQAELLQREIEIERTAIHRRPEQERRELANLYRSKGIAPEVANDMATEVMRDPDLALQTHAREEMGIRIEQLGSPWQAAIASFIAFAIGAVIPLLPWFFGRGGGATLASVVLGAVAAIAVGLGLSRFTGRSAIRSALRQLLITGVASGVTYLIGKAVGVSGTP
jgi:VIT1/CCC1 family predicted Fe2+/Mn2+ transporter